MTAGAGGVSAPPGGWRRLVRRAGPGTVRARVTVVAGVALTAAVVLGLVVMYRLQLNSVYQTIHGQLGTYATQIEQSAVRGIGSPSCCPPPDLGPTAQAQGAPLHGTVPAAPHAELAALPRASPRHAPAGLHQAGPHAGRDPRRPPDDLSEYGEHATVGGRPVAIITTGPHSLTCRARSSRRSPGCW